MVCYNFMPVLDWTRTDLRWGLPNGGSCMRFDINDFAAFEIHILKRPGALEAFAPAVVEEAARRFAALDDAGQKQLARNVTMGLPGSTESMTLEDVRAHLAEYGNISADRLRQHFIDFLSEIVPVAEEARRPARLPPGRSAVPAARPAAHHVDGVRLPGDPRCGR